VPPILIELKRRDHTKSSVSSDQIKYILNAKKIGANACIAVGAQGAMAAVRHYVQQK
jgi:Holliday junction resolvase